MRLKKTPGDNIIPIEVNTASGWVEFGPDDDYEDVSAVLPHDRAADYSNQITLASGRFRAPLVAVTD